MKNRKLFTKLFWLDATERAVATFAEVLSGFAAVDLSGPLTNVSVDWSLALTVAGVATGASLLKAIAAAAKADTDTASLTVDTKPLQ